MPIKRINYLYLMLFSYHIENVNIYGNSIELSYNNTKFNNPIIIQEEESYQNIIQKERKKFLNIYQNESFSDKKEKKQTQNINSIKDSMNALPKNLKENIKFIIRYLEVFDCFINISGFCAILGLSYLSAQYIIKKKLDDYVNHDKPYIYDIKAAIPIMKEEILLLFEKKSINSNLLKKFSFNEKNNNKSNNSLNLECEEEFRKSFRNFLEEFYNYIKTTDKQSTEGKIHVIDYCIQIFENVSELEKILLESKVNINNIIIDNFIGKIIEILQLINSIFKISTLPNNLKNSLIDLMCLFTHHPNFIIKKLVTPEFIEVMIETLYNVRSRRKKNHGNNVFLMKYEIKKDKNNLHYADAYYVDATNKENDIELTIPSIFDHEMIKALPEIVESMIKKIFPNNSYLSTTIYKALSKNGPLLEEILKLNIYYDLKKKEYIKNKNPHNDYTTIKHYIGRLEREKKKYTINLLKSYFFSNQPVLLEEDNQEKKVENNEEKKIKNIPIEIITSKLELKHEILSKDINEALVLICKIINNPFMNDISRILILVTSFLESKIDKKEIQDLINTLLQTSIIIKDEELKMILVNYVKYF